MIILVQCISVQNDSKEQKVTKVKNSNLFEEHNSTRIRLMDKFESSGTIDRWIFCSAGVNAAKDVVVTRIEWITRVRNDVASCELPDYQSTAFREIELYQRRR